MVGRKDGREERREGVSRERNGGEGKGRENGTGGKL